MQIISRIEATADDPQRAEVDSRLGAAIAIVIVAVSMLGAVVSWRASVWSGIASGLDRQATQELLIAERARTADHGEVAEDLRLVGRYEWEHALARRERSHPALSRDALDRATTASAVSRTLTASVLTSSGGSRVTYDSREALRQLAATEPDLARGDPQYVSGLAKQSHDKTVRLVAIGTLLLAALFFLTLAEVSGGALRRWFAVGGVALTLVAAVWFAVQSSPLPAV